MRDVVEPNWRIRRESRDTSDRTPRNVKKTRLLSHRSQAPPLESFPVAALPEPIAGFIRAGANSLGCDESFLAVPLLSGLGSAIGATKRIELKPDWTEPAVIWSTEKLGLLRPYSSHGPRCPWVEAFNRRFFVGHSAPSI